MSELLISVGDYVLVQEGQVDQPKIVVWDDVAVDDVVTSFSNDLLIDVFDAIVTEDPGLPSIITTVAVSVFDLVRVQEGQADSDAIQASVFETVTVDESVTMSMTRLRINIFDAVTVEDAPGIFAQGPLGVVVFENVTVQEALERYLSLYINAFDEVTVIDGALNMDVFDAVSVVEDVTIKLARLVLNVNETVTVTESQTVFGPVLEVGALVFDDLVTSESVTLVLTSLRPTVSEDVTVSESVTVSISSINLEVNVSEDVSVVESITAQPNPMQINEFTEIIIEDVPFIVTGLLLIQSVDSVTVDDVPDIRLLPMQCDVFDAVSVTERIALRIGKGGRKRHDLTIMGAGE